VRALEGAFDALDRASECAAFVSKQRALDQTFGRAAQFSLMKGGRVDRSVYESRERRAPPVPAFSQEEHSGPSRRDHRHRLQDLSDPWAVANDLLLAAKLHHFASQHVVLTAQPDKLQSLFDRQFQLLGADWLRHIVMAPALIAATACSMLAYPVTMISGMSYPSRFKSATELETS
jgi:hypothetical protein